VAEIFCCAFQSAPDSSEKPAGPAERGAEDLQRIAGNGARKEKKEKIFMGYA